MENSPQLIVLADFASEEEYRAIKGPHGTAAPTLKQHKILLAEAEKQMTALGNEVAIIICDLAGYTEFCKKQKAVNTPQTVAAYVIMKHGGVEDVIQPGLQHQNITILPEEE